MTEEGKTLNRLAREQMKLRLLKDIAIDLTVCEIEGLDKKEYCEELKAEIDRLYTKFERMDKKDDQKPRRLRKVQAQS